MELKSMVLFLISLGALMGCAARPSLVVHDPVGPEIARINPAATQGDLVVYSADRVSAYAQSEYPVHTPYTIYSLDDKVLKQVQNVAGSFNQDPERVSLPQGRYRVKALDADSGEVVVTVIIVPGKTTVVDLDGTAMPQDKYAQGQLVRLPDGHVVGWQADCNANPCR